MVQEKDKMGLGFTISVETKSIFEFFVKFDKEKMDKIISKGKENKDIENKYKLNRLDRIKSSSDDNDKSSEIPIGVSCRTCDRLDCSQRAFPPLHKKFDVDINTRGVSVYVGDKKS